jgi:hypothetical protein
MSVCGQYLELTRLEPPRNSIRCLTHVQCVTFGYPLLSHALIGTPLRHSLAYANSCYRPLCRCGSSAGILGCVFSQTIDQHRAHGDS